MWICNDYSPFAACQQSPGIAIAAGMQLLPLDDDLKILQTCSLPLPWHEHSPGGKAGKGSGEAYTLTAWHFNRLRTGWRSSSARSQDPNGSLVLTETPSLGCGFRSEFLARDLLRT
jgi:hypothetical protein